MKKEIKDRWLAALRSGEYRQGRGYLRIPGQEADSYCCLGVLCDLAVQDQVLTWQPRPDTADWETERYRAVPASYPETNDTGFTDIVLPYEVQRWSGLSQESPTVSAQLLTEAEIGNATTSLEPERLGLTNLNDSGLSFERIAQIIEAGIPAEEAS